MSEAVRSGEIEVERTCLPQGAGPAESPDTTWIRREELMTKTLEAWPLETIEPALGDDCGKALPGSLRLTGLHLRVPRCHVALLEH